jgi:hypothetical protein
MQSSGVQVDTATLAEMALNHWEKWLPNKVAELQAEGRLGAELQAAATLTLRELEELIRAGYQEHEAAEIALPRYILLRPEPDADLGEEEREELAELERQYQEQMKGWGD